MGFTNYLIMSAISMFLMYMIVFGLNYGFIKLKHEVMLEQAKIRENFKQNGNVKKD